MSINTAALATRVAEVGVTITQAQTIISEVINLIIMAEQVAQGLTGDEKFQSVMAGLSTVLDQMSLSSIESKIRSAVGPIVSLLVSVFNFLKMWDSFLKPVAQAVTASAPASAGGGPLAAAAGQGPLV